MFCRFLPKVSAAKILLGGILFLFFNLLLNKINLFIEKDIEN